MGKTLYKIIVCFQIFLSLASLLYLQCSIKNISKIFFVIFSILTILLIFIFFKFKINENYIKQISLFWVLILIFSLTVLLIKGRSVLAYGVNENEIVMVEGKTTGDSIITEEGNFLISLKIVSCKSRFGHKASAEGLLSVLLKCDCFIESGSCIFFKGKLIKTDDNRSLFISDSFQVTKFPSSFFRFRSGITRIIQKRLLGPYKTKYKREDYPFLLALMLLLGRLEVPVFPLKKLAINAGVYHVLALSGMHLHFFIFLSSSFLILKKMPIIKKFIVSSFLIFFVFIVGPKSSLLRALIYYFILLGKKDCKENGFLIFLTELIQMIFFPFSLFSIGAVFSYFALIAIVLFSSFIENHFLSFIPMIKSSIFSASFSAVCFTGIISLVFYSYWNPFSIIIGPSSAFLIFIYMFFSLLILIFSRLFFLNLILEALYSTIEGLFSWSANFATNFAFITGWTSYILMLVCLLTAMLAIKYTLKRFETKRGKNELEFYLRFSKGNHKTS